jgi:hypothetical protein
LEFDRHSIPGWRALAVIGRVSQNVLLAREAQNELLALDPLHHFARAEAFLAGGVTPEEFLRTLGGEYPDQTLLELAIGYENIGRRADALALLKLAEPAGEDWNPLLRSWRAWLENAPGLLERAPEPAFVFPYRAESLPVLEWAAENSEDWTWPFLLALNLWAVDRGEEAASLMEALGQEPDFGPFYVARGLLLHDLRNADPESDLRQAVTVAPDGRILHIHLIRHLEEGGMWKEALDAVREADLRFSTDFNLALLHAKALIHSGEPERAADILGSVQVLPSEHARESHGLWEQAHTLAALDAYDASDFESARAHLVKALEWPESLGQGRPYDPEERLVRFILGRVEEQLGNTARAREAFDAVMAATGELELPLRGLDLLALQLLEEEGRAADPGRTLRPDFQNLLETLGDDLEGTMIRRALRLRGGQR